MTDLTTLHQGGSGLGRDIHDADTGRYCTGCVNLSSKLIAAERALEHSRGTRALWCILFAGAGFMAGITLCAMASRAVL